MNPPNRDEGLLKAIHALACANLAVLLCFIAIVIVAQPIKPLREPAPSLFSKSLSDRPLLSYLQKHEALSTGRTAFSCCGKHFVVEAIDESDVWRINP